MIQKKKKKNARVYLRYYASLPWSLMLCITTAFQNKNFETFYMMGRESKYLLFALLVGFSEAYSVSQIDVGVYNSSLYTFILDFEFDSDAINEDSE